MKLLDGEIVFLHIVATVAIFSIVYYFFGLWGVLGVILLIVWGLYASYQDSLAVARKRKEQMDTYEREQELLAEIQRLKDELMKNNIWI
ncbi:MULTISPECIES: hypothetical protein [Aeromonas]|uniref:hypothetical protein n=1 Tax=Aeromonas TaxID=642 RepID=UPI0012F291AB|nr:hypothetical protein [Aeromonas salmonicida]VXA80268.1 hypothetical protein AERO9A_380098 [Aeromonas salmonicida]